MERPEGLLLFELGATQPFMAKFMTPKVDRPCNQRMSNKATGGSPFKGRSHLFVGETRDWTGPGSSPSARGPILGLKVVDKTDKYWAR